MQLTASPHFDTGARDRWRAEVKARADRPVRSIRARRGGRMELVETDGTTTPYAPTPGLDARWQLGLALDPRRFFFAPRRTPAARPAARRPRSRAGASSRTASADPGEDGESEPPAGVVGGTEPRRAWRGDTWVRWRCCPECSAVLEYVAGGLYCPRSACPLHDVRHPPADRGGGR